MSYSLLLASMLSALSIQSSVIWEAQDGQGQAFFSDTQPSEGHRKTVRPSQGYIAPNTGTWRRHLSDTPAQPLRYQLQIVNPVQGAVFMHDTKKIPVEVTSVPQIASGHRFVLFLNGQIVGAPQHTGKWALEDLDRGEYQVQVRIDDPTGRTLATSGMISFTQKRWAAS